MYPSIREFFAGKTILITGATGLVGKFLIEKLVRSCPDVKKIYVLIRPKRGVTSQERFAKFLDQPLFKFKLNQDYLEEKVIPLEGDIQEPDILSDVSQLDALRLEVFHRYSCGSRYQFVS